MSENPLKFKSSEEAEKYADEMEQLSNMAHYAGFTQIGNIATEHQTEAMQVAKDLQEKDKDEKPS